VLQPVKPLPTTDKRDPWRLANMLAREAHQNAAEVGATLLRLAVSLHEVVPAIRLIDDHAFGQVIAPRNGGVSLTRSGFMAARFAWMWPPSR